MCDRTLNLLKNTECTYRSQLLAPGWVTIQDFQQHILATHTLTRVTNQLKNF